MPSPLEYLFLMMMTAPGGADQTGKSMAGINPAAGDSPTYESMTVDPDGTFHIRTILMEPREIMSDRLEAPLRITPDWIPWFKIGTDMDITIDETGQTHPVKIIRIESITDAQGTTVQVILDAGRRNDALQPGMTATARVRTAP